MEVCIAAVTLITSEFPQTVERFPDSLEDRQKTAGRRGGGGSSKTLKAEPLGTYKAAKKVDAAKLILVMA